MFHVSQLTSHIFGTVAEWSGSALQKLLLRFESARYLSFPFCQKPDGFFFMLRQEEEKFVRYWQEQRQHKKQFLKKFSVGLPVFAVLCVAFFINFLSGWYGKADKELRQYSSLIFVILLALAGIGVFMAIFSARHRWDQNESAYQSLLRKKESDSTKEIDLS